MLDMKDDIMLHRTLHGHYGYEAWFIPAAI